MSRFLAGVIVGTLLTAGVATAASHATRIFVDGKEVIPDVPAQIIDGRTMVPIRFVAEALGLEVVWDDVDRAVRITSPQGIQAEADEPTPPKEPTLSQDAALNALAEEIISLGYDVRYVEQGEGKHYARPYWNYVQVGIQTDEIPPTGNWNLGIGWPILEALQPVISKYFPQSEVWIVYVFNEPGGRYSQCTRSVPKFNLGGCAGGESGSREEYAGGAANRWSR